MAIPPNSPRLPSPPPAAEIQIGPKSPAASDAELEQQQMEQQMEQSIFDANAKRRIRPGTRAADFAAGPPLVPLNELDSAFQFQEHLSALHYHHTGNNTVPINRDTALLLAQAPPGADRTMWLYELCRFLIAKCNSLIVGFLFDTPACSAITCPEMRASEWQFLCAVHEQPRSCCAIDYCCHTLDWAANVVTNPKIFPSRFAFSDPHDKNTAVKNLINVFRRLHRIFAHAWFQHRGVFWSVEAQTGLYVFFKTVCDMYDLLPAENYKLPPEAEGLNGDSPVAGAGAGSNTEAPTESAAPGLIPVSFITDKNGLGFNPSSAASIGDRSAQHPGSGHRTNGTGGASGTNTRRHVRSSPSTGSAVTTVIEQDEDLSSSTPPSIASVRPISILQNSHLARSRSHTPPVVTETEILEDGNEADTYPNSRSSSHISSTSDMIADNTQHNQSPLASDEQGSAESREATDIPQSETMGTKASEPSSEEPNDTSVEVAEEKETDEEPAEPVTIIVAGDKLAQATRPALTTTNTQKDLAEDETISDSDDSDDLEVENTHFSTEDTNDKVTSGPDSTPSAAPLEETEDSEAATSESADEANTTAEEAHPEEASDEETVLETETNDAPAEETGDPEISG